MINLSVENCHYAKLSVLDRKTQKNLKFLIHAFVWRPAWTRYGFFSQFYRAKLKYFISVFIREFRLFREQARTGARHKIWSRCALFLTCLWKGNLRYQLQKHSTPSQNEPVLSTTLSWARNWSSLKIGESGRTHGIIMLRTGSFWVRI